MSKYTAKIEEFFYSLGNFKSEFKTYLKSLDILEQKSFIEELYMSVMLDGVNDKIRQEAIIASNSDSCIFRFTEGDYQYALNSEPTQAERLFSKTSEKLKYRATYYFHERKRDEVYSSVEDIQSLYKLIKDKAITEPSHQDFLDNSAFKFEWKPIAFPESTFTVNKLKQFLKTEDFKSCFYLESHYTIFKENSFEYFKESTSPKILSIPLRVNKKLAIAEKIQNLFKLTSELKREYSIKEYDFRKPRFAEILMANFLDYRSNTFDEVSFKKDLKTTLSRMR